MSAPSTAAPKSTAVERPSLRPIATRLLRPILGRAVLAEGAVDSWQVYPAEITEAPKAYYLDGQLDRFARAQHESTLDVQVALAKGSTARHDEVRAFLLRDAHLIDNHVYTKTRRYAVSYDPPSLLAGKPTQHIARAALAASAAGVQYFGHWLSDDCATGLLEPEVGPMVSLDNMAWVHIPRYREIFERKLPVVKNASFDELILLKDHSQGSSKRRRYKDMQKAVARHPGRKSGHSVFVLRGRHGSLRNLGDEMDIAEKLARRGFDILDPMRSSTDEIVAALSGAKLAVGVEGSGIYHALFCIAPDASMVCIMPPDRITHTTKNVTDALGMKYGFLVGTGTVNDFRIDETELIRTIDLVS